MRTSEASAHSGNIWGGPVVTMTARRGSSIDDTGRYKQASLRRTLLLQAVRSLMLGCVVSPFLIGESVADGRVVYLVPSGFPASDSIHIVEDGDDERFCELGLEGLDLVRTRLGYTPCGSDLPRSDSQLSLAERSHEVNALILVDDRAQLSPEAVRLLAGAIQRMFGNYYVVPFGIELHSQRSAQAELSEGSRAMVVGERLYQDHYKDLATGPWMWFTTIDANIRSISAPDAALETGEIDTDAAAHEVFERAVQHYQAGEFERAYWLFSDVARVPGLGRPQAGAMIGITIAAQGGDAFLDGEYQRAFDAWHRFSSHSIWIPEDVVSSLNEEQQRTYRRIHDRADIWSADALLHTGNSALASQLYSTEILEQARSSATRAELLETLSVLSTRHGSAEASGSESATDIGSDSSELARSHDDRGQELYVQERYLEAVDEFNAAYAEDPQSTYLYNAAVAYERQQDYTRAADYFARYLVSEPNAPDSEQVRQRIDLLRTRALQQAENATYVGNDSSELARSHYDRGQELYVQERYLEAVDEYNAAYAEDPQSAYLYNAAVAYERQQDYTRAADYFARYLVDEPDAPDSEQVRQRIDLLRTKALQ